MRSTSEARRAAALCVEGELKSLDFSSDCALARLACTPFSRFRRFKMFCCFDCMRPKKDTERRYYTPVDSGITFGRENQFIGSYPYQNPGGYNPQQVLFLLKVTYNKRTIQALRAMRCT